MLHYKCKLVSSVQEKTPTQPVTSSHLGPVWFHVFCGETHSRSVHWAHWHVGQIWVWEWRVWVVIYRKTVKNKLEARLRRVLIRFHLLAVKSWTMYVLSSIFSFFILSMGNNTNLERLRQSLFKSMNIH